MNLTDNEKRVLFQFNGYNKADTLDEIRMAAPYMKSRTLADAAYSLMGKLKELPERECMEVVQDIRTNYHLPYEPKTIGELLAEARQKSGAVKLAGHDIMALERFAPDTRHMIVFDVLSHDSPVGTKGERTRLFLTDQGYQKSLENQERGFIRIKNHAKVLSGRLHYDHKDRDL